MARLRVRMSPLFLPRGLLAVALFGLAVTACRKSDQTAAANSAGTAVSKQPVEVVAIARRDLTETLTLVGSLAANESAEIRPEASGLVRTVSFIEGERVVAGQVLVKIDDGEIRAQLAQAVARHRLAELNLKRSENLSEARSMSQAEADRFSSEFAAAEAELALLKVRLARTEVKAPFDGMVGSRSISPGDYVTALTVITKLNDLSRMKIDFQVPERFAAKVRPGTAFTVRSQALASDQTLAGEVYFVSSVIDRATRSSEVKGFLTMDSAGLKPGMFANVDLVLEVRRGVLTVPEGAILTTVTGAQVVAVKEEGGEATAEFIPVRTGLRAKGYVEIAPLTGVLDEQRRIVASGVGALILFPGAKLEARPFTGEFHSGQ